MDQLIRIAAALTILLGLATLTCNTCCFSSKSQTIESSAINSYHYEKRRKELVVDFSDGSSYLHKNVPEKTFHALSKAPSKGQFYNQHINGQFPSQKQ